jgi:VWFA-related protein
MALIMNKLKPYLFILAIILLFYNNHQRIYSESQKSYNQQPLYHEVTVTLKLVQVYVTDKKENPVIDLKKEDFIIYDNGKKQAVTEFEKHILSLPSAKKEIQPEIIKETKIPPPREVLNRKFFLFFDFAYNNPRGILKARKAALHFIDTYLQPSDEVGVLSYSAIKSLKLHEYLTTDHTKVRKVVESFGLREVHGRAENLEEQYWRQATGENPLDASQRGRVFDKFDFFLGKEEQRQSILQAANFAQKMTDLAKALRYIPGYKNIIFFSSGVPYSLSIGPEFSARVKYGDMVKELANSNCKIYTLDTEDLGAKIGVDSKIMGFFTLQNIAKSTGGKYFGNINFFENHLEKIQNLTGCYYVVGYYVDEKWDGKYHEIEVEVNRPGCKVYAQRGYFNPKPFSEYSNLEKTLHLVDLALNERSLFQTPLRFPMRVLPCSIKGKTNLVQFSCIPMEKIQEIAGKEVELVSIIFDKEDNIVKIQREKMDFSRLPRSNVYYSSFLELDPGEYKCRLVLRNLETGRGAVGSSSVFVPGVADSGIRLDSPLLLKPEKEAFYLRKPLPIFSFDATHYTPVVDELGRGERSLYALVRCLVSGVEEPRVRLSVRLIYHLADGERELPVGVSVLKRYWEDGAEVFFLELRIEEFQSGEYLLRFIAEETKTKSSSRAETSFKVK